MQKFLFEDVFSKRTAWKFLIVGGAIILYALITIQSFLSAGAVGYIQLFSGLVFLLWGMTELLSEKHKWSTAILRITVFGICAVILYFLAGIFAFWWGMQ